MSFQHGYPYGDVHELNLDWIMQTMQEFINSEREAGHTPTVSSVRSFFTHKYPYGDIHELNLDWVIQTALRMEEIGDSVDGDIGELKTRMTTAEGNISALENTVGGLSDSVGQIETEIEDIQGNVEDLQATAAQHTTQIAALDQKIDTQVVANPADAATGTLSKIEIAGTVYTVEGSGGSEVEANPTGEATDTLQKIGIDGTIYEVGGSSEPVSKTVTGNPINITDAADAPIVSGEVAFEPIQDLHGYDKPWAGGAGKNKLPMTVDGIKAANTEGTWNGNTYTFNGVTFTVLTDTNDNIVGISANGTATANTNLFVGTASMEENYIVNGCPAGGSYTSSYSIWAVSVSPYAESVDAGTGTTITDYYERSIRIRIANGYTANNLVFYPMVRLSTETDPAFEAYSNICPITGYDDFEVEVTGKNLVSPSLVMSVGTNNGVTSSIDDETYHLSGTTNATGYYFGSRNNYITLPAGTYTLSVFPSGTFGVSTEIRLRKQSDNARIASVYVSATESVSFTLDSDTAVFVAVVDSSSPSGTTISGQFNIQIEKGSTATSYEPYQSTTYTIDLDGTRYGGTVDLVSGEMEVTKGYIASYAGETIGEPWLSDRDEYISGTTPTTGAEVVYTLATPLEVQLTPEQIRTLKGINNISTNMTDMSLEYITESYQPLVELIERSAGHHYSTQERVVGTWFGKPLYEKSWNVSIALPSGSANTWVSTGIAIASVNCDGLAGGELIDDQNQCIAGSIGFIEQKTYFAIYPQIGGRTISKVTVRYTKTTD